MTKKLIIEKLSEELKSQGERYIDKLKILIKKRSSALIY